MTIHTGHHSINCLKGLYIKVDYISDSVNFNTLDPPFLLRHRLLLIFRQQASG